MRDNYSLRKVDPDVSSLTIQLWLLNLFIVFSLSSLCSESVYYVLALLAVCLTQLSVGRSTL